ncbi:MAG: hypothetical protein AAGM22_07070 [Acidobacteriota bacterium]
MKRFEVPPQVEVSGMVVLAVVDVMGAFRSVALRILEKNGIKDPQPDQWFPLRAWLSSFDTIVRDVGPNTLHQIGRHVASSGEIPPELSTLHDVFYALDESYYSQHRGGGDIGHYHYIGTGERSGTMVCTTPYPSDFDRGVITALAERFEPVSLVDVRLDESSEARTDGGLSCTYLISW